MSSTLEQTPEAKIQYDARWQRIMDCVALKQPDRMPVAMFGFFWFAKYGEHQLQRADVRLRQEQKGLRGRGARVRAGRCRPAGDHHRGRALHGSARLQAVAMAGPRPCRRPGLPVPRSRVHERRRIRRVHLRPHRLLLAEIPAAGRRRLFRVRPVAVLPGPALLPPGRRHPCLRQAGSARIVREDRGRRAGGRGHVRPPHGLGRQDQRPRLSPHERRNQRLSVRFHRRLLSRRHRNDEGPVPPQGQAACRCWTRHRSSWPG